VYTRGRRSTAAELPLGENWYRMQRVDIVDVDRGGKLTYHGPGQLVGYPIVAVDAVGLRGVPAVGCCRRLVNAREWIDAGRRGFAMSTPRRRLITRTWLPVFGVLSAVCLGLGLVGASVAGGSRAIARDTPLAHGIGRLAQSLAKKSEFYVRIPTAILGPRPRRLYAYGSASATGPGHWGISLSGERSCPGAEACTLAFIAGYGEGRPVGREVRLARGIRGRYLRESCANACVTPDISWRQDQGELYTIGVLGANRQELITMANQAITARSFHGPIPPNE